MKIYDLSNLPESILGEVGGKAKGLFLLSSYSFNVPKGFIICDIKSDEDVLEAFEYYNNCNLGKVAVRSSATIEDGENFSNAGQYETFLNVEGKEAFVKAVNDCVSSLDNFRSQVYSKTFLNAGDEHQTNKMTVVVQQMVDAKCAGVLFTQDPMNKEAVLIECVSGLGESLVSGEKSSEQYRVSHGEIEKHSNTLLAQPEVMFLFNAAVSAEKLFGMPMDIEWAMGQDGKIYFLQARPITVIEDDGVTIDEFNFPHDVTDKVITSCNVREMLSTAVTPLSMSTSVYCWDYGMRKMMAKTHAIKTPESLPDFSCITPFYNNMFFNQSTNYINAYRIAGTAKETSDIVICGRVLEDFPDKFADYSCNLVRAFNLLRFLPYVLSAKKAKEGIDKIVAELKFNFNDDIQGLYKQALDNFHYMKEASFHHYCSSYFSGAASMLTVKALNKVIDDQYKVNSLLSGALTNIPGIESAKVVDMMLDLAKKIIKDNKDAKNLTKEQIADYLDTATGEVKESYDAFMKANGHRGINESELRLNCWKDDRLGFAEALKGVISSADKDSGIKNKEWTEYRDELLSLIKPAKRKNISQQIDRARSGAWHREYTKSRVVKVIAEYKKLFRILADKLVEKGIIPDADLIFFVTKEEIGELIKGNRNLVKKAMKRRRLYPLQCAMKFDEVYSGAPVPIEESTEMLDKSDFQGIPASPGIVKGKAKIIKSVDDANNLKEGEIMVVSITDVGWTPYYCLASGLITEIGSCLSHGVVVAREYGLPTIVNVRDIMRSIKDGDIITMDGSKGTISIEKIS